MSQLHFYSPNGQIQQAHQDGKTYAINRRGIGLIAWALDEEGGIVHEIDWTDHAVHIDEMKKALQAWADSQHEVDSPATVGA